MRAKLNSEIAVTQCVRAKMTGGKIVRNESVYTSIVINQFLHVSH